MIKLKEKSVEQKYECDVLVAGGGIAGISSALAAARCGASVILLEKQCLLGGLATLGLITHYLALCDGNGNQIIFGIGEELLKLSIKNGYEDLYPKAWLEGGTKEERAKNRFEVQYNAQMFGILAEQLLIKEGVRIFYDTQAVDALTSDGKIDYIITNNKSGLAAVKVKSVVDCTGDADICFLAGENVEYFRENRLASWYYHSTPNGYKLSIQAVGLTPTGEVPEGEKVYDIFKPEDVSEVIIRGHERILNDVMKKRKEYGDESIMPVTVPLVPSFRMTRRLSGAYTLDEKEVFKKFDDCVGKTGDWRKRGPVFDIPLRTLHGNKITNLFAAGRCISVTDDMWDITRVIPVCAVTGEASGVAAALCAKEGISLHNLKAENVRKHIDLR